jgi:hypothetical protein
LLRIPATPTTTAATRMMSPRIMIMTAPKLVVNQNTDRRALTPPEKPGAATCPEVVR